MEFCPLNLLFCDVAFAVAVVLAYVRLISGVTV